MSLVDRVKNILTKPRETWPVIAAEPATVQSIYTNYVMILAAIPAIATLIGMSLVGFGGFGVNFRIPIVVGLVQMVVGYVLSLVMVFVLALIVDALAPTFGGVKNQINALKLVAYSFTAAWVGGIFSLIPMLSILGLLVSLYSIWLLYTGVSTLMRNPPEKSAAYTAVVIVIAIVVWIVIAAVLALLSPARMGGFGSVAGVGGGDSTINIKGPDGASITLDTKAMEAMGKRMEEAAKRNEAAAASGDPQAAGKAAAEVMAARDGREGLQGRRAHGARGVRQGQQPWLGDDHPRQRRDRPGRRPGPRHRLVEEDRQLGRPRQDRDAEAARQVGHRTPMAA
jgi:hypothetical protein